MGRPADGLYLRLYRSAAAGTAPVRRRRAPAHTIMLRINELKLPLNHPDHALRDAIVGRLGIAREELIDFTVFKRSYDARKKSAIVLIYAIDVELRDEAAVLARLAHDQQIAPAPDTATSSSRGPGRRRARRALSSSAWDRAACSSR